MKIVDEESDPSSYKEDRAFQVSAEQIEISGRDLRRKTKTPNYAAGWKKLTAWHSIVKRSTDSVATLPIPAVPLPSDVILGE